MRVNNLEPGTKCDGTKCDDLKTDESRKEYGIE